ncbi:MAG: tetratricopeptide repeat protein [Elusimicrobiota bacterium]
MREARRQGDGERAARHARELGSHFGFLGENYGLVGGGLVALEVRERYEGPGGAGEVEQADVDYGFAAVQAFPKHAGVWRALGGMLRRAGRHETALEVYQVAAELDPASLEAYAGMADSRYKLGDYDGAVEDAKRALEIDPRDAAAKTLLKLAARHGGTPGQSAGTPGQAAARRPARTAVPAGQAPAEDATPERGLHVGAPPPPGTVGEQSSQQKPEEEKQGILSRTFYWLRGKINSAEEFGLKKVDGHLDIEPGERQTALRGAALGAKYGVGAGAVGGAFLVGTSFCAPSVVNPALYVPCIGGGAAGGAAVGAPLGAYVGAFAGVSLKRIRMWLEEVREDVFGGRQVEGD